MLQKPLRRFLRVALMTPLFVGCFYSKDLTNSHVKDVFRTLCRLLGCLLLFTFANVLKTLLAKIMASHFHKEAHFEKMQEALQKVPCQPTTSVLLIRAPDLFPVFLDASAGVFHSSYWIYYCSIWVQVLCPKLPDGGFRCQHCLMLPPRQAVPNSSAAFASRCQDIRLVLM